MTSLLETFVTKSSADDGATEIDAPAQLVDDEAIPATAGRLDAVDIRLSDDRRIAAFLGRWRARDVIGSVRQRRTVSVSRRRASWIASSAQVSRCSDAAGPGAQVR